MTSYSDELKQIIKTSKNLLDSLNVEKSDIEKNRSLFSEEEYINNIKTINERIASATNVINENQDLLSSYDLVMNNIATIIDLQNLSEKEENLDSKSKIDEEILKRRAVVLEKLDNVIPKDVADDIKKRYFDSNQDSIDSKVLELEDNRNAQVTSLNSANKELQNSIQQMQKIFEDERNEIEEHGPFATIEELDEFTNRYLNLKNEQNQKFEDAKKKVESLEKELSSINQSINERVSLINDAKSFHISPETYERVLQKVGKREVLDNILSDLGLREVVGEKNKILLDSGKVLVKKPASIAIQEGTQNKSKIKSFVDNVKKFPILNTLSLPSGDEKITSKNLLNLVNENINKGKELKEEGAKKSLFSQYKELNDQSINNIINEALQKFAIDYKKKNDKQNEELEVASKDNEVSSLPKEINTQSINNMIDNALNNINLDEKKELPKDKNEIFSLPEEINTQNINNMIDNALNNVTLDEKEELSKDDSINSENIMNLINNGLEKVSLSNVAKDVNSGGVNNHSSEMSLENDSSDYGYKTIISHLVRGLKPEAKDGKRYRAANINVAEEFINELTSGNYLYNIVHVVPAIIKAPIQFIRKAITKFTYTKEARERMATIKERLDDLSEKDLMILLNEYGNHIESEKYGSGLNVLITDKLTQFVHEKVDTINKGLEEKYKDIFECVGILDSVELSLKDDQVTPERKEEFKKYRDKVLRGKAKEIASIRKDYNEAKALLASGLHGFSENARATESKMSYVGYRFAKDHDLDVELLDQEAKLERAERNAIQKGDDYNAVRVFVEAESLLRKNTSIEKSIFGKRSTGKKYYSPLAEMLEYRNDPFVRDIFTSIAVFGALNALTSSSIDANKVQSEIDKVNESNEKMINSVNNIGNMIKDKREVVEEGMKAQNYADTLNVSNMLERKALDQSSEVYGGWSVGTNAYYNFRTVAQDTYHNFYETTQNAITDITNKYASNQISSQEVLKQLSEVSKNSQSTLVSVANDSLPHLVKYANNHSQFDLAGVQDAMNYIVQHPNAITAMNKSMTEITDLGDELSALSLQKVSALQQLPDNLKKTFFGAATATALAMNVSSTMNQNYKNGKYRSYGNNVTDIVESYVDYQDKLQSSKKAA